MQSGAYDNVDDNVYGSGERAVALHYWLFPDGNKCAQNGIMNGFY